MFFRRIGLLFLTLLLAWCVPIYGSEEEKHLDKKQAFSFKPGSRFFQSSEFTDAWKIGTSDLTCFNIELAYEVKLKKSIGLEFSFGHSASSAISHNVLFDNDFSELDLSIAYFSPSAKYYYPLNNTFILYGGVGPDIYYTYGEHYYRTEGYTPINLKFSQLMYGLHGLIGLEYYIYKNPGKGNFFDWPVSLELQYKYSLVIKESIEEELINSINSNMELSLTQNDIDIGGHIITLGLKWHF